MPVKEPNVVDIAHIATDVPVSIEHSNGVGVDVTSAERWLNPDGSVFALVTWEEWPNNESGWEPTTKGEQA